MTVQFYKINPDHKLILWNICMEKMDVNHILKIYITHIYQIISFSPKLMPGIVQKKKKANIKSKDKTQ